MKRVTRSSSIKILAGLPPVKRPRTDNSAEDFAWPCKLRLRSSSSTFSSQPFSPVGPDETFQAASPIAPSRNKYIYEPEGVICKKYEPVYKKRNQKIRSCPNPVTLLNAIEKIKQCAKEKEKYKDLYHEILDKDLIAAEFKCHKERKKNITRSTKEKTLNQKGNPRGDFSKVANYIDKYVLSMNQVVGLNALMEIYFDTDYEGLPSTLRKRISRLKIRLLNYYGDQIMILKTTSNSSVLVINSAIVKKKSL